MTYLPPAPRPPRLFACPTENGHLSRTSQSDMRINRGGRGAGGGNVPAVILQSGRARKTGLKKDDFGWTDEMQRMRPEGG
jgi:hypothetical protein